MFCLAVYTEGFLHWIPMICLHRHIAHEWSHLRAPDLKGSIFISIKKLRTYQGVCLQQKIKPCVKIITLKTYFHIACLEFTITGGKTWAEQPVSSWNWNVTFSLSPTTFPFVFHFVFVNLCNIQVKSTGFGIFQTLIRITVIYLWMRKQNCLVTIILSFLVSEWE